jgi:hypothetical protein
LGKVVALDGIFKHILNNWNFAVVRVSGSSSDG